MTKSQLQPDARPSRSPVPLQPDDITAEWLTDALAVRFPGVRVAGVEITDVMPGTTTRARFRLDHTGRADLPRTVVVKVNGPLSHRLQLVAFSVLYPEARLFADGSTLPLETPEYYYSAVDRTRLRSVLVMEDLTERGVRFHDAATPLSAEQVADGLRGLAALHAAFWGLRGSTAPRWLRPWPLWRYLPASWVPMSAGARKLRADPAAAEVPPDLWQMRTLMSGWRRYRAGLATDTPVLLHGDAHVGNTYSTPAGSTGFLDWQLVGSGSWEHDVGYFMVSALDRDTRRDHETDLLRSYLTQLEAHGVAAPNWDDAWRRYRRTPAYGLPVWITTLGLGDYQSTEISTTTALRFAHAALDLATDDALR